MKPLSFRSPVSAHLRPSMWILHRPLVSNASQNKSSATPETPCQSVPRCQLNIRLGMVILTATGAGRAFGGLICYWGREKVGPRTLVGTMCAKQAAIACVLASLIIFLASSTARMAAVDPHRMISQYGHTAWRTQDGFLDRVVAGAACFSLHSPA